MCFFQKFNFYVATLLNHPSWFQNIVLAGIVGVYLPIAVNIFTEFVKEKKVLDLRLMKWEIALSIFAVIFLSLFPSLLFPILTSLKGWLSFIILCVCFIAPIIYFSFKAFNFLELVSSKEKQWNRKIVYLEKRKNELQKSKSKSQLIHEIAEEWNCVWSEKSIPYNKQEELFNLFFEMAKIVQNDYGSVRKLFETIKQNLRQISHNTTYHLYEFCLRECLRLYLTTERVNFVLDFLIELICEDMPCILNDYDYVFACWNNLTKKKKEFIELVEVTKELLIERIFFKNLNEFKTLPKVFKLDVCSKVVETAFILALKDKLKSIVLNPLNTRKTRKDAEVLNLFFEKFLDVPNKILVLVLWIFDAFSCLIKMNPDMNRERFWEMIDLFPILKDSKDKLCNMFKFLTDQDKKLLEKLRYTDTCVDELFEQCKNYICGK